jgi:growth factor-regulated tyrosine kinase substrate
VNGVFETKTGANSHAGVLSDMHDKLSQAVKLYDQLLTEQVSHPRWAQGPSTSSYQPPSTNSSPYPQTNGYPTQWSQHSPQPTPAQSYGSPLAQQTNGPDTTQRSEWHGQYSQSQQVTQPGPQSQSQHYTPMQAYAHQSPSVPYSSVVATQPPMNAQSPPPQPVVQPVSQPPHMVSNYQQTPLDHSGAQAAFQPSATLSRSNTYTNPAQRPSQQYSVQRSNTVNYVSAQQPPGAMLPNFPSAPTTVPQSYATYGPTVPTSPSAERKEALLIDL